MSEPDDVGAEASEQKIAQGPVENEGSSEAPTHGMAGSTADMEQETADAPAEGHDEEEPAAMNHQESEEEDAGAIATEQDTASAAAMEQDTAAASAPATDRDTRPTAAEHQKTAAMARTAASTSPGHAARMKLTFSGPPNAGMAKPYPRSDYSHSAPKLLKIAHDNEVLVKKLTDISRQPPKWVTKASEPPPATLALATGHNASAAVNRRKAAATIAQENHALYQRLVAIKPSKDISRDTLNREHTNNIEYLRRASNFKPGQVRAMSSSPHRR